jgi:hypothetical protein
MSVKKLFVRGELPKSPRRAFLERIRLRSFRPLAFDEEAEERHGWCALGRPLELEPPPEEVFQSDYLTLGLRWDRYRFPAALLNARLEQAARTLRGNSVEHYIGTRSSARFSHTMCPECTDEWYGPQPG